MTTDEQVAVTFRSPSQRNGFAMIPHVVLTDKTLTDASKVLYGVLLSYAMQSGGFKRSQQSMAEDVGKEDRTVRRLLKELNERGLIMTMQQGQRMVNAYVIEDVYALYDSERPTVKKSVRAEIGPDKNVRSGTGTKMSAHGGQKCPVREDKNVPLLNTQEKNKEKKAEFLPNGSKQERTRIMPTAEFIKARDWLRKKGGRE